MLHDSLKWWQILLPTLWIAIGVVGLALLLRRPTTGGRDAEVMRRRRITGVGLAAAGLIGFFATRSIATPSVAPPPATKPPPIRVDNRLFASSRPPGLRIEAPDGWRIDFDDAADTLRIVLGPEPWPSAPAHVQIESSRLEERADPPHLLDMIAAVWVDKGLTPGLRFERTIGGLKGIGTVVTSPDQNRSFAIFIVQRDEHIVSTVQCFVTEGGDPRSACDAPLDRVAWMTPTF